MGHWTTNPQLSACRNELRLLGFEVDNEDSEHVDVRREDPQGRPPSKREIDLGDVQRVAIAHGCRAFWVGDSTDRICIEPTEGPQ